MSELKKILASEIEEFRQKGHQYVKDELSMMQFKHLSGGFGVYAHRGGQEFMIRLRIPSGILSLDDLKKVYEFAIRYQMERIHLTTRQAIQFHGLTIDEICDLMAEALEQDIYTRGSGGNYPRNVAISPLSGVDPDEAFDVTPYALAVGNHFLQKIYTYHLPRKLKVSFSSSHADDAHCTVQDLGFLAVKKDGKDYFQVYIGGGLGQNARVALKYEPLIDPKDVLYHIEATVKLFMAEGDYENRNRARIRYIVDRLGEESFLKEYQKYLDEMKAIGGLDLEIKPHPIEKVGQVKPLSSSRLFNQKQEGLYSVYLHPVGGQLKVKDLKKIIEFLETIEAPDIRLAMSEGVYFRNLTGEEAEKMLALTEGMGGETQLDESVSCIGAPTCQIGQCNSQEALRCLIHYFDQYPEQKAILPCVHFSGCVNSCGVHQIGKIGFTGKKKKVEGTLQDCFTISLGGNFEVGNTQIGEPYGEIPAKRIPEFLEKLAHEIKQANLSFDDYLKMNEDNIKDLLNPYLV